MLGYRAARVTTCNNTSKIYNSFAFCFSDHITSLNMCHNAAYFIMGGSTAEDFLKKVSLKLQLQPRRSPVKLIKFHGDGPKGELTRARISVLFDFKATTD